MQKLLWKPSDEVKYGCRMADFMNFVNKRHGTNFREYAELYRWSVENIPDFWAALWDYFGVISSVPYETVVDDLNRFPGAKWFCGAKLNYAENILRYCDAEGTAITFRGEDFARRQVSRRELKDTVERLAAAFRAEGIKPGDAVAGYLPNLPETIIAMLAAASVGAVWCSCATDIGANAVVERISQIEPKVLVTTDGYRYKGKTFSTLQNVREVAARIPSIQRIMFSSGTTGKPKCMVQSHSGILVNQLKELTLHCNIQSGSKLLYITTCSWMMWNWQAAALGTGAELVLYDGNPSWPDDAGIWKVIEEEKVTDFGLSASYIHLLMAERTSTAVSASAI